MSIPLHILRSSVIGIVFLSLEKGAAVGGRISGTICPDTDTPGSVGTKMGDKNPSLRRTRDHPQWAGQRRYAIVNKHNGIQPEIQAVIIPDDIGFAGGDEISFLVGGSPDHEYPLAVDILSGDETAHLESLRGLVRIITLMLFIARTLVWSMAFSESGHPYAIAWHNYGIGVRTFLCGQWDMMPMRGSSAREWLCDVAITVM